MENTKMVVGFIGVGLMGHGMAKNVLKGGFPLVVMAHRNRAPVEDLLAQGASEAKTPREMAENCDIVHLCVSGSPQVEAVMRGKDGLLASKKSGLVIIDCSTSDPVSTMQLIEEARGQGITLIDAPLGRTPKEAEEGALDAMVGSDDSTLEKVRPVLECWSGNIIHLGEAGLGHKMKLVNNFIALGYGALYAEAIAIARKAGLSAQQFHAVIGASRMRNGFYDTFMKYVIDGDENAHRFTVVNAHKDMRYTANMANASGAVNPIQAAVKNSYAAMEAAGKGDLYLPMLADFISEMNGVEPD